MSGLANLARETTGTTGTGTITLSGAAFGCLTFALAAAAAGIASGSAVTYGIEDGSNSEVGRGVWTTPSTLTRATILASTNSNNAINLSGTAEVFIIAVAEDISLNLISSVTTSASQASVSFTSIPAHYKDIIISIQGRLIRAGQATDQLGMRFNNDTAGNYSDVIGNGSGTGNMTVVNQSSQTMFNTGAMPASTATANFSGQQEIVINNYAGATFNKTFTAQTFFSTAMTTGNLGIQPSGGTWNSTAAIDRVDLLPAAGTGWVDGSVVALYGRR